MLTTVFTLYQICLIYNSYVNSCEICPSNGGCFFEHSCPGTNSYLNEAYQVSKEGTQIGQQFSHYQTDHSYGNFGDGSYGNYNHMHGSIGGHHGTGGHIVGRQTPEKCSCQMVSELYVIGDYYSAKVSNNHFFGIPQYKCYRIDEVSLNNCNVNNGHLSAIDYTSSTEKTTEATTKVTTQQPITLTPTKITETTTLPVSSVPKIQSKQCSKLDTIINLAHNTIVKHSGLDCNDGIHGLSESVPIELCGAPSSDQWIRGDKVIDNCPDVKKYSAVASFPGSNVFSHEGVAGVMVDCNSTHLKIATQDCNSYMQVFDITMNSNSHNADSFYTITW